MTQPLQIFISYKRENQIFAEELREKLIAWGYRTWMDVYDIPADSNWPDAIQQGLEKSDVVIGVMSPLAMQSRNVKNEWDWAIVYDRKLILLMYENCIVHHRYVSRQNIDFSRNRLFGYNNLRNALKTPQESVTIDPYLDYLRSLYERINTYLAQKIIPTLRDVQNRPEPIRLRSEATPNAVLFEKRQEIDPLFAIGGIQPDENREQVFDDFEQVFKHYDGRVLLLGEPGAGKTITLLHFGRDAVVKRLQDRSQPLPILMTVPTWEADKQQPFADWVSQSYGAPQNVDEILECGEALLLLDGLDELGGERQDEVTKEKYDPRVRFMHLIPKYNQVLVTCRVKNYRDIGEKVSLSGAVTLKPLDATQMHLYLEKQPELMAAIDADDSLRNMLSTPLLLSFFAFAYQGMTIKERKELSNLSKIPGDLRDAVFKKYVEERYEHERRKINATLLCSLGDFYQLLGQLAMDNVAAYWQPQNQVNRTDIEMIVGDEATSFISFALRLSVFTSFDSNTYKFVHLLLRDYFAYVSAAPAIYSESASIRVRAIETFGELKDDRALSLLELALGDENVLVRRRLAEALGHFGLSATELLISLLNDDDARVRTLAVEAVSQFEDNRVIKALIKLLEDEDRGVRDRAAKALEHFGGSAIEALDEALLTGSPPIRRKAINVISRINTRESMMLILRSLEDEDNQVRRRVVEVIDKLHDKRAVEPLMVALLDKDKIVRRRAVEILGKLGGIEATGPLITALSDVDSTVRRSAVEALGKSRDPNIVSHLIQALEDPSSTVRETAATVLGDFGDRTASYSLMLLLHDHSKLVRLAAARALGQLREARSITALINALSVTDDQILVDALAKIGSPAVEPLVEVLSSSAGSVRVGAIMALGKIGDKRSAPALIHMLHDKNWHIQRLVVSALGNIGDPIAVNSLQELLLQIVNQYKRTQHHSKGLFCDEIAFALMQIGTPEAFNAANTWANEWRWLPNRFDTQSKNQE